MQPQMRNVGEQALAPALRVLSCLDKRNEKVTQNSVRTAMGICTGHKGRVGAREGEGEGKALGRASYRVRY